MPAILTAHAPRLESPAWKIAHRRLGRTGRLVSELGLGCAELSSEVYGRRNDVETALATVHKALELGIDYFDTSAGYGNSEERLGLALHGVPRDSYFLATKTGTGTNPPDYSHDATFKSVENSLRLLGTDYLDLVQIHDPTDEHIELAFSQSGALGALQQLKQEGVIGAIGLGVRDHPFLRGAIRRGEFDTMLTYGDFNLVRQTARDNLFDEASVTDTAIILGSPVLMGYLTDRDFETLLEEKGANEQEFDPHEAKRVRDWAQAHGQSTLHLAIQYVLREPRVSTILVGGRTPEEVEQNVHAATTPIPEELWQQLQSDLGIR